MFVLPPDDIPSGFRNQLIELSMDAHRAFENDETEKVATVARKIDEIVYSLCGITREESELIRRELED